MASSSLARARGGSSLARARERAAELRQESRQAGARLAASGGRASDDLTTLAVDPLGQLVSVEFAADVLDAGPDRWASSLLAVYRRACEAISTDAPGTPAPRPGPVAPGSAMPGKPLAPEQARTRELTERMVERAGNFAARQGSLVVTGSADEVWLTFDGAGKLLEARTTRSALERGPVALAAATTAAWADGRRQLSAAFDSEVTR